MHTGVVGNNASVLFIATEWAEFCCISDSEPYTVQCDASSDAPASAFGKTFQSSPVGGVVELVVSDRGAPIMLWPIIRAK